MKRREMVKENQDFQEIIHNHRFLTNECFTIYQKSYQQSYPQFGIAVKKSFGHAVSRNKIKRQVRSLVDKYKKLYESMSDEEFDKYMTNFVNDKDHNFYLEIDTFIVSISFL